MGAKARVTVRRALVLVALVSANASACISSSVLSNVDLSASSVVVTPASAPAGDGNGIAVTVGLRDAAGRAFAGYQVTLAAQGCRVSQPEQVTDARGLATGTVRCDTPGQVLITAQTMASEYPIALTRTALVSFYAPANQAGAVSAGTALGVQAVVRNAAAQIDISSDHTVGVTCTDPNATLPPTHALSASDAGTWLWSDAVVLQNSGVQTLTIVDITQGTTLGSVTYDVVAAGTMRFLAAWDAAETRVGEARQLSLSAYDSDGQLFKNYVGTIAFSSSDTAASLPSPYTFTAGDQGQRAFDGVVLRTPGTQSLFVKNADGVTLAVLSIVVKPGPAVSMTFSLPAVARAGDVLRFSVRAYDSYGNIASDFADTLRFVSTDPACQEPNDTTFVASDAGVKDFNVTFRTAGMQQLVVQDANNGAISWKRQAVYVQAVAATRLRVTSPGGATAGVPVDVTITAVDDQGNVAVGYTGTIALSGSDTSGIYLPPYTFQTADHGTKTLLGAATFFRAGAQAFAAQDVLTSGMAARQNILVASNSISNLQVVTASTAVSLQPNTFTIRAVDLYGNTVPTYTGSLHFSTSDPNGSVPADAALTVSDAGSRVFTAGVTFANAGNQTLSVQDLQVSALNANAAVNVLAGAAVSMHADAYEFGYQYVYQNVSMGPFVTVYDLWGNLATGYVGTVGLTTTDPGASVTGPVTFQVGDQSQELFVTFVTLGNQNVTIADIHNPALSVTKPVFVLHAADMNYMSGFSTFNGRASVSDRGYQIDMVVDANQQPWITWNDQGNGSRVYFLQHTGDGNWVSLAGSATAFGISASPNSASQPSLAIDANGQPAIAWQDQGLDGNSAIFVAHYEPTLMQWVGYGGSDGGGGISGDHGIVQQSPSLAFDSVGHPVVAWQAYTTPAYSDIYVRKFTGAAWQNVGPSLNVSNANAQAAAPKVRVDSTDNPWVVWAQGTPSAIYLRRFNGAAWTSVAGSGSAGGLSNTSGTASQPAMVLDSHDHAWVAWTDDSSGNEEIYVREYAGAGWVEANHSASGGGISNNATPSAAPSLALDGNGLPVAVWWDQYDGRSTVLLRAWNGSAWQETNSSGTGAGTGIAYVDRASSASNPVVQVLGSGEALIGYNSDLFDNQLFQPRVVGWP